MPTSFAYPPSLFNSQRLLFDETRPVAMARGVDVPHEYYERGWTVIDDVHDADEAVAIQEAVIGSAGTSDLPLHERFEARVQLGKADQIPVCDDVVATSFQILHFDMGLPVDGAGQLLVTHVGVYLPMDTTHSVTARTRLVELDGLLAGHGFTAEEVAARVLDYTRRFGDGWEDHNTLRLAALVRLIDAMADKPTVHDQIDKTVGQWFLQGESLDADAAHQQELDFLKSHGVDLAAREHQIALEPGQLLLLDNLRVVHGRVGRRRAREIYNFMFGVESIGAKDVVAIRRAVAQRLVS